MPLWDAIFRGPRSACLQDGIVVRPITATAANPVIRCRCGMPVSLSFCRRSFPCWKVPGETAFRRHLLEFVISWSASEVAPGGPASVSYGEGAGQIAVSPSPSRIRYQLVCDRGGSRWPGTGFLRRRCRSNRCFAVTFSVVGVLTGLEAVCRRLVLLWLLYFGMVDQIRMAVGMGEEVGLEG